MGTEEDLVALGIGARIRQLLAEHDCTVRLDGFDEQLGHALRTEYEQQRAREHDAQKLMALGELVAGVVHEVRNIVTSIRGFAQVARRKQGDPAQLQHLLETIERESTRCAEVTGTFLKFARHEEGKRKKLDINKLIDQASSIVRHQLRIHDIQLVVERGDSVPAIVADRNDIVQVMVNLILNAQQALGRSGTIYLETSRHESFARLVIRDTGPGVPIDLREQIFEPFFTTKPPGEGTGLGLAVSKQLVEDNGGTLVLDCDNDAGARFVIQLPAVTE